MIEAINERTNNFDDEDRKLIVDKIEKLNEWKKYVDDLFADERDRIETKT